MELFFDLLTDSRIGLFTLLAASLGEGEVPLKMQSFRTNKVIHQIVLGIIFQRFLHSEFVPFKVAIQSCQETYRGMMAD